MPHAPSELTPPPVLVVACGALVRELRAVIASNHFSHLEVAYLPARLHNRPESIVPHIERLLDERDGEVDHVLIGYADCGTGGGLDARIETWQTERGLNVSRLPGNHCYEFFAGSNAFARLHEEELGTLFLTDYLARHFDLLIWRGMGLDDHPELLPLYFGNYRRVVFLSQTTDPDTLDELSGMAHRAAERLGLDFDHRPTGLHPFHRAVASTNVELSGRPAVRSRRQLAGSAAEPGVG